MQSADRRHPACVCAGVHLDGATPDDLAALTEVFRALCGDALREVSQNAQ